MDIFVSITNGSKHRQQRRKLLKEYMFSEQWGICFWCRGKMCLPDKSTLCLKKDKKIKNEATFEHLVPKSKGGKDRYLNLVLTCLECNQKRGDDKGNPYAR